MKLPDIEEAFRGRARIVGSVFLLKPEDAISLVTSCKDQHIGVFGAEGFYLRGEKIQPSMEHSICDIDPDKDRHDTTIGFLRQHLDSELWFEVMVDAVRHNEPDEHA